MRNVTRSSAWLLAALVTLGCDSDQPLQVGARNFTLTVSAPSATVPVYDVWDVFEDNNDDQLPDDQPGNGPDVTLWCELAAGTGSPTSIPWHFLADIRVLRAGDLTPERITSNAAQNFGTNLSLYDQAVLGGNFQARPPLPPGVVPDTSGRITVFDNSLMISRSFRFANARRLTIGNRDLILSEGNFLNGISGIFGGVCPSIDLEPAGIDGEPFPYTVELAKGDTIIVDIRRFPQAPAGLVVETTPTLSATVQLDGFAVAVQGTTDTSDRDGSGGFGFSFTAQ